MKGVAASILILFLTEVAVPTRARFHEASSFFPQQAARLKSRKIIPASPEPAKEIAVPFAVGETLNYVVAWSAFSAAATAKLTVVERRPFPGGTVWHFQAAAHSQNPVRSLFTIDDQFDSYTDAATLDSRQYEMYLDELGRKVDRVYHLQPQGQKLPSTGSAVIVPKGTRDPVGAFYSFRAADWQKTPELVTPVYDGHDVYEMHAHADAAPEDVTVPAGHFSATRVAVTAMQNRSPVAGLHLTFWIARDSARTPAQIVAELPFGTLRISLASVSK